jgi:pilus assembly protein CpaB
LSPGARAIAIPVSTGGASTGLLSPGDRVDVVLIQNFTNNNNSNNEELRRTPLTRRSVAETVVENLRVLAIDAPDAKPVGVAANPANGNFGRTVTLEVTAEQVEQINVAAELGKLSVALRSITSPTTTLAAASPSEHIKPTWAGDVSPALSGAAQEKLRSYR